MKPTNKLIRILKEYPLAIACVVVILICIAAIILRGGATLELTAQEADLNSRIRTINQNVKSAKNLAEDVADLKMLVEQVEGKLFNREQRAVNINFFYGLEGRLDVRITNIAQMPAEDPIYAKGGPRELKQHSTIGYNITVNGSYEEILLFLYELHRVDPLIRVADFQIAAGNNRGGATVGSLEARLRVLVFAEKN